MQILILEPYFGGSHRSFIEVMSKHSRHEITAETMPPRFWKWRLAGASVPMAEKLRAADAAPDLILFSNMLDVASVVAMAGRAVARLPKVIYFHENQLTYPRSEEASRDAHLGLINITSALCCDECWFNSDFHRHNFLNAIDPFLEQFPDFVPKGLADSLMPKSKILPLPVEPLPDYPPAVPKEGALRILWNHRWEHEKGPEEFFGALEQLVLEGIDFELVIIGEGYRSRPPIFDRARLSLGNRIRRYGFVEDRHEYAAWIRSCDVVVSCARQEYFGVSVAEAVLAGCIPILPNRLVYPDFIPPDQREEILYTSTHHLIEKLRAASRGVEALRRRPRYTFYDPFLAERVVREFDARAEELAASIKG